MEQDFDLIINDVTYRVVTPQRERISRVRITPRDVRQSSAGLNLLPIWSGGGGWQEEMERLSDVQNLVMQLYEALNVGEHHLKKERHILAQLEQLQIQLIPLEQVKLSWFFIKDFRLRNNLKKKET